MIVACWRKLSLSNYCPSSACHCVLCSQHVLTLTPDTTALCRSAGPGTLRPASRRQLSLLSSPGRQPSWEEARTQVLQQRWQECDSSLEPGACSQTGMCPTIIHSFEHSQILASKRMFPAKFFQPRILLVVMGGGGGKRRSGIRINHF